MERKEAGVGGGRTKPLEPVGEKRGLIHVQLKSQTKEEKNGGEKYLRT